MIDDNYLETKDTPYKLVSFYSIRLTLQANIKNMYLSLKIIFYSQRNLEFRASPLRNTIFWL